MRTFPNAEEMELWQQETPRRVTRTRAGWLNLVGLPIVTVPFWGALLWVSIQVLQGLALNWFGVPVQSQVISKPTGEQKGKKTFFVLLKYPFAHSVYSSQQQITEDDYGAAKIGETVPLRVISLWPGVLPQMGKYPGYQKQDEGQSPIFYFFLDIGIFFLFRSVWLDERKQRESVAYGQLAQATVTSMEKTSTGSSQIANCAFEIEGKKCEKKFDFHARDKVDRRFWVVALPSNPEDAMLWEYLQFRPAKQSKTRTIRAVSNSSESP